MDKQSIKNANRQYLDSLGPILNEIGFDKKNKDSWVKENEEVIIVCQIYYEKISLGMSIRLAVWLKGFETKPKSIHFGVASAHILCKFEHLVNSESFYSLIAASAVYESEYKWELENYSIDRPPQIQKLVVDAFQVNAPKLISEKVDLMEKIFRECGPGNIQKLSTKHGIISMIKDDNIMLTVDVKLAEHLGLRDYLDADEDARIRITKFDRHSFV